MLILLYCAVGICLIPWLSLRDMQFFTVLLSDFWNPGAIQHGEQWQARHGELCLLMAMQLRYPPAIWKEIVYYDYHFLL